MKNIKTAAHRRRRPRWDRIICALVALAGFIAFITLIIHHAITSPKERAVLPITGEFSAEDDSAQTAKSAQSTLSLQVSAEDKIDDYLCDLMAGTDISKHNGEITTDGDFVIVKASEGIGYVHPRFNENVQKALNKGQLCGVYHYARPDTNLPTVEAEHFVETIRPYLGQVMLVLDWEEPDEIGNTTWVAAWMWQVFQMTGVRPVLYTSASVAQDYDWTGLSSQFDLWVACYVQDSTEFPRQDIPYDLSAWRTIIWQYSTNRGTLDHNVCSLSAEEWQARCAISDERADGNDLLNAIRTARCLSSSVN